MAITVEGIGVIVVIAMSTPANFRTDDHSLEFAIRRDDQITDMAVVAGFRSFTLTRTGQVTFHGQTRCRMITLDRPAE